MKVVPFDRAYPLIRVGARVYGPSRYIDLNMVVDTGATVTLITPEALSRLGYDERDRLAVTTITTALGKERGFLLRVRQFRSLGYTFEDFPIHAHALADSSGIDGLLGINFLSHFDYGVKSKKGVIPLDWA